MEILHLAFDKQSVTITGQGQEETVAVASGIDMTLVNQIVDCLSHFPAYDGAVVYGCENTIFTDSKKSYDLLQVLTETTNKPFALANGEDETTLVNQAREDYIWNLEYVGYNPGKDEYSVESLLTIGNGYFGLRGALSEMKISNDHYPATYLAGLYNQAKSMIGETEVSNEDFVNAPNGQYISIKVDDELLDISQKLISLVRKLNLKNGLFTSEMVVEFASGKQVKVTTAKVANMENTREYAIKYAFTPLNFAGDIEVIFEIDGDVYNYNVERYRSLEQHHLDILKTAADGKQAVLVARTKQSQFTIVQHSELMGEAVDNNEVINTVSNDKVVQSITVNAKENKTVTVEKYVHIECLTNQEIEKTDEAVNNEYPAKSFDVMLEESTKAWNKLWQKSDITVDGDLMSQKLLHVHTYHLLVSASPNGNKGLDASITARGLHGEAYRGHIFWDEIFILPFYIVHFPETAKQILKYRYDRLPAAKQVAKEAGYQGAMFPWQSGLDGTEQSQDIHLNPMSGKWDKDYSRLQRHVSLAIAYNVWLYWNNTHDNQYLKDFGGELLLEIAHFWQSGATYDQETNRYYIDKVMGPDEFHETYPGSEEGGFKNNAYTNMMVVWLFEFVDQLESILGSEALDTILAKTDLTKADLEEMDAIKGKLGLDINDEGIIGQYEGYFNLKEIDWDYYRQKYGNIYRMDRILRAEGESADDYKVAKQADTLMVFYNFAKEKVDGILADLNYQLPDDYLTKNLHYYLDRTSHGSTLSRVVHCQLAAMIGDQEMAWRLYQEALYSDYQDIQGGTTAEGIHAGVMAATVYITLSTFAGIDIREAKLALMPNLPKQWDRIQFNVDVNGVNYQFDITANTCKVMANKDVEISFMEKPVQLVANKMESLEY